MQPKKLSFVVISNGKNELLWFYYHIK